jgi:serine/threonine protein phosphatase 1
MIRRLFSRLRRPARRPGVPHGQRLYAIGDIHGRADLLERLHERIRADGERAPPNVERIAIYLGDYVDRGMNSRDVIASLLVSPLAGFRSIHLKGNHEDCLLRFLDDAAVGPGWFAIGGDATAASYGVSIPKGIDSDRLFDHVQAELRARIPPEHIAFFERLDLMHEAGDYLFVHAGIRPGIPIAAQEPYDLLWIRDEFLHARDTGGRVVVHGHSLSTQPEIHRHRIGIDTGAYATNVLTCLVLEGTERRFIST